MADAVPSPFQLAPGEVAYAAPMSAVIVDVTAAGSRGGRALTAATTFEIDDVIDPADTRRWILTLPQP